MPPQRLVCLQHEGFLQRRTSHLLNLPDDIFYLIFDQLQDVAWLPLLSVARLEEIFRIAVLVPGLYHHPLVQLSMTCKALRTLCLPRIFRHVFLFDRALDISLRHIFVHTRRVFIVRVTLETLSAFLQLAPNICESYFQEPAPPLSQFLRSEQHEVIALASPRLNQQFIPLADVRAPLRVLIMRVSRRYRELAAEEVDLSGEKAWLDALLPQIRSTLEVLVVPAESTRLSLLTDAPWPHMRELVLYGACPPDNVSLLRVFDMMPNLRSFSLTVAVRYDQDPLLIWPHTATEAPDLSRLRRFTISSPSTHDLVYANLPAELEGLALRDAPRFYERCRHPNSLNPIDETYSPGVLTCSNAFSIFKTLSCAALVHLELVVIEDEQELDLLAYIASACPLIELLEYHCYRNVFEKQDLVLRPLLVSLDTLARAFSAFAALRDLRLNIDTPWTQYTASPYGSARQLGDGANASSAIARVIAQAVPWLDTVTVLAHSDIGVAEWIIWSVCARGVVVDVERLEADPNVYYKTLDY